MEYFGRETSEEVMLLLQKIITYWAPQVSARFVTTNVGN